MRSLLLLLASSAVACTFEPPPDVASDAAALAPDAAALDAAPAEPIVPADTLLLVDGACPAGWVEDFGFTNRYLRGHDGDTELAELGGSATHSHTLAAHTHTAGSAGASHQHSLTLAATITEPVLAQQGPSPVSDATHGHGSVNPTSYSGAAHTHAIPTQPTLAMAASETLPGYREVTVCRAASAQPFIPPGSIWLFARSCPDGWSEATSFQGHAIRGHDLDGETGERGGGTHRHAFPHDHGGMTGAGGAHAHSPRSTTNNAAYAQIVLDPSGSVAATGRYHDHSISFASAAHAHAVPASGELTSAVEIVPAYREVIACTAPAAQDSLPEEILMLADEACPVGWSEQIAFRNRLLRGHDGDATPEENGGSDVHSHSASHAHGGSTASATHTHEPTVSAAEVGDFESASSGITPVAPYGHSHDVTVGEADPHAHALAPAAPSVSTDTAVPEYVEVIVCQRSGG